MGWEVLTTLTVSREWQVSPPVAGAIFRVRHLTLLYGDELISQALLSGSELSIFDVRSTYANIEPEIFSFVSFAGMVDRRIAIKSLVQDAVPWMVVIERYVLEDNPSDHPVSFGDFSAALAAKADLTAMTAALAAKANVAAMTSALAAKADLAAMTAALALKADLAAMTAALAVKADLTAVTAALALKADLAAMTAALAVKADLTAVTAALALKPDSLTLTVQTSDATLTEMVIPQRILIHANSSAGYEIRLTGHSMGATPEFIYWLGSGAIYRGAAASTTILQTATGTRRSSLGNGTNWTPLVSADTVNGALKIQVKGDASKVIKWVASIQLTEVW
jgi:hypothetical protein